MGFCLLGGFSIQVKLVLQGRVIPILVLSFNSHISLANSKLKKVSLCLFRRVSKKISIPWQLSYVWAILPRDNRSQSDRISSELILLSKKKKKKKKKEKKDPFMQWSTLSDKGHLFVFSSQWWNAAQAQCHIPTIFCICYFLVSCSDSPKSVKERLWQSPARR